MPYFHVTAVFEAQAASPEDASRRAAEVFATPSLARVRYYEHDTSGGFAPSPSAKARYFTIVADFDAEAQNEDHASEIVEDALDALSADDFHYLAHGLTPGEQRVQPGQASARAPDSDPQAKERPPRRGQDDRRDRRRGGRGRGRGRETEEEVSTFQEPDAQAAPPPAREQNVAPASMEAPPAEEVVPPRAMAQPDVEQPDREVPPAFVPTFVDVDEEITTAPPPRSSDSMQVTLSITLRASELTLPTNGPHAPDHQELLDLAIAEARRRHPELPAEVAPGCETASFPGGDTRFTLTWQYALPVPSASDAA